MADDRTFRMMVNTYLRLRERDRKAIRQYIHLLLQEIDEDISPETVEPSQTDPDAGIEHLDSDATGQ